MNTAGNSKAVEAVEEAAEEAAKEAAEEAAAEKAVEATDKAVTMGMPAVDTEVVVIEMEGRQ